MSIKISTFLWAQSEHKGTDLLLLLAIADIANDDGDAWPAVKTLAKKIRMSERNTQRVLSRLVAAGSLAIHANAGPKGCHIYTIQINPSLPLFMHRGDTSVGGDKLSPPDTRGTEGVTFGTKRGDTATSPESSRNVSKPSIGAEAPFRLPDWVPAEHWKAWLEVRTKKKVPNTKRALEIAVGKLQALKAEGYPPDKVLDCAIEKGWRGIFRPTDTTTGKPASQANWWDTDQGMLDMAAKVGVSTKGLTSFQLRARINEALARTRH